MSAYEWMVFGIGFGLLYVFVLLPLVSLSNRQRSKVERDQDDAEQAATLSQPAPLPHVRAGTAYGQEVGK